MNPIRILLHTVLCEQPKCCCGKDCSLGTRRISQAHVSFALQIRSGSPHALYNKGSARYKIDRPITTTYLIWGGTNRMLVQRNAVVFNTPHGCSAGLPMETVFNNLGGKHKEKLTTISFCWEDVFLFFSSLSAPWPVSLLWLAVGLSNCFLVFCSVPVGDVLWRWKVNGEVPE